MNEDLTLRAKGRGSSCAWKDGIIGSQRQDDDEGHGQHCDDEESSLVLQAVVLMPEVADPHSSVDDCEDCEQSKDS